MEKLSSSSKDMVRLLAIAVAQGDWDLCKELARFLVALDDTGKTLKEALELVELRSPVEDMERSFMFESARLMPPPVLQFRRTGSVGGDGTSADGGSEGTGGDWGGSSSVSEIGASGDEVPAHQQPESNGEDDGDVSEMGNASPKGGGLFEG